MSRPPVPSNLKSKPDGTLEDGFQVDSGTDLMIKQFINHMQYVGNYISKKEISTGSFSSISIMRLR